MFINYFQKLEQHTNHTKTVKANDIEEYLQGVLNTNLTMFSVTHMVFHQHDSMPSVLSVAGITFVILAKTPVSLCMCFCTHLCLAGDRGEQGDKGAKGYGLPGFTGDQGPNGKF